jgi:tRNA threonylcarbamoyladenosine biosynthesis protein TsaB
MSCILCLETATKVCSIALSLNDDILFAEEDCAGQSHATLLPVFVQEAVRCAKKAGCRIDAVAVGSGPGSYTGLRIGVSEAKGLCYGWGVPLIGVPTLEILASEAIGTGHEADIYCAMIDARRMEVYSAVYDRELQVRRKPAADVVDGHTYENFLAEGAVLFFGDGAAKCKTVISSKNAIFAENIYPSASGMAPLARKYCREKIFKDVAYFEPFYLKEFQTNNHSKI